jgi:hypothetical protein
MCQFDVLFTGRRESDGVLSDVFDCGCEELRVNLSGRSITVFGGQVLALSDSYPRGLGGVAGRTAGTIWRLEEVFEEVMEVLELAAMGLR